MPNWIVWNRTVFTLKLHLGKTELFDIELFWHFTVCGQKLYLDWIVWIRTVWLKWIAWNRNVFDN